MISKVVNAHVHKCVISLKKLCVYHLFFLSLSPTSFLLHFHFHLLLPLPYFSPPFFPSSLLSSSLPPSHHHSMMDNGAYQGRADTYPNTHLSSHPLRVSDTSPYNTLGGGQYEVVDLSGDNYQRLQRPTLTPGMLPRFVSSPENSALSPTSTMTSYRTHSTTLPESIKTNGTGIPPPLPSTARRGNIPRPLNTVEDVNIADGGPASVGTEGSFYERERIDSSSMLLPKDRSGSKSSPDFVTPGAHESLYSPHGKGGQVNIPMTPRGYSHV